MTTEIDMHNPTPGVYNPANESLANADAIRLTTGTSFVDYYAVNVLRDGIKGGNPGDAKRITNASISRVHIADADRAGMSLVGCDYVGLYDAAFGTGAGIARNMVNLEPEGDTLGVTNVYADRVVAGKVGAFAIASKGKWLPVTAQFYNLSQLSGTTCGNGIWVSSQTTGKKTLRVYRSHLRSRRDSTLTDVAHVTDPFGVKIDIRSNPNMPVFSINTVLALTNVWFDGQPVRLEDCQWQWHDSKGNPQGVAPTIVHDDGFMPARDIAQPAGVPKFVVVMPPADPPPPVVVPPPDPCAALQVELAATKDRLEAQYAAVTALKEQLGAANVKLGLSEAVHEKLTADNANLVRQSYEMTAHIAELTAKIDAARTALG